MSMNSTIRDSNLPTLSNADRIRKFRVDCDSKVVFSDWKPDGRVYTKQFKMKNISGNTINLTYELPTLPCFFTPFPERITLPQGQEYVITISFQPTAPIEVQSFLEFRVKQYNNEAFKIDLFGELPLLQADTEWDVHFKEDTAVFEENEHMTLLKNTGQVTFLFDFTLPVQKQAFSVSPVKGLIEPGKHQEIVYKVAPECAGQLISDVGLRIRKTDTTVLAKTPQLDYIVKLTGKARFPHFVMYVEDIPKSQLEFQNICILEAPTRDIEVRNQSAVRASFQLQQITSDAPYSQVVVSPQSGVIQPFGSAMLKVQYFPAYSQQFYRAHGEPDPNDNVEVIQDFDETGEFFQNDPSVASLNVTFSVQSRSAARALFQVKAKSVPAQLQLSSTKLDFGYVMCGVSKQLSFYMKNCGKIDCPFEFAGPGIGQFQGVPGQAHVDPNILKIDPLQVVESNIARPLERALQPFPLKLFPASGIAINEINTTIQLSLDLTKFTAHCDAASDQQSDLSYIPPQPLSMFVQLKTPGSPIQFIHIVATILPQGGQERRPAPITMNYAEQFTRMRRKFTLDQLVGCMVPRGALPATPNESALFDEALPEFETEYASESHFYDQSLGRYIRNLDPTDVEIRPNSNVLLPSDSLLQEFKEKDGLQNGYAAQISSNFVNFGYTAPESSAERIIWIKNNSEDLQLFAAITGKQAAKGFVISFLGIGNSPFFNEKSELEPIEFAIDDGFDYRVVLTKGAVSKIPPGKYGFYSIQFSPEKKDESYFGKYGFILTHQPFLLYRCFRHAVVGAAMIQSVSVCGYTRSSDMPALLSATPTISRPVVDNNLKLPPVAPGSVSRTSFALTNTASTFALISISPLLVDFIQVQPQIVGLSPGQTSVISVCITFPTDSLKYRQKYGFTSINDQENAAQFTDLLCFNINGSEYTRIDIKLTAVCAAIDFQMQKLNDFVPVMKTQSDQEIQPVVVRMSPVSLGSESSRLIGFVNRSLLPVEFESDTMNSRDAQLMHFSQPYALLDSSEIQNFTYILKALDRILDEGPINFEMKLGARIPFYLSMPTPKNLIMETRISSSYQINETHQKLIIATQITKRKLEISPKTINIPPIVPHSFINIPINVENLSHCQICYIIEIHEYFPILDKLQFEKSDAKIRKYQYVSSPHSGEFLVPKLYNKLYDPESVIYPAEQARCPQIFIRQGAGGIILPHSSIALQVTCHPSGTEPIRARIFVKIVEMDISERTFTDCIKELEQQAIYMQGTSEALLHYERDNPSAFECRLECLSEYPTFQVSDISCPYIGSSQLRDVLQIDQVNDFLNGEVSMAERVYSTPCKAREQLLNDIVANQQKQSVSRKPSAPTQQLQFGEQDEIIEMEDEEVDAINDSRMHLEPVPRVRSPIKEGLDLSTAEQIEKKFQHQRNKDNQLLKEFPIVLGPDNQNPNKTYHVIITLINPTSQPVDVTFELPPDGPTMDDCPWIQALPNVEKQVTMSYLARKIFTLSPENIHLEPGEKQSVTIDYSHIEQGIHELVVLCKINGGRLFFFHLIGQTLSEKQPAIVAPVTYKLLPVAVGEIQAPRQYLRINNPGNVPIKFNLCNPELMFEELVESDATGSSVVRQTPEKLIQLLNPSGVLAPQSSTGISMLFTPNQVGFIQIRYQLFFSAIDSAEFQALQMQKQAEKFFDQETGIDLPDETLMGIDYKIQQVKDSVQQTAKKQILQQNDQFVADITTDENLNCQSVDIIGYGFIRQIKVPNRVMPTHALVGNAQNPACAGVSLTSMKYDKASTASQRGKGLCELSCGRLVFGAIPVFSQVSAVFTIAAAKRQDAQFRYYKDGEFKWELKEFNCSNNVKIECSPSKGTLQFGESCQLFLTLRTSALPAVFLEDLPFHIKFEPKNLENRDFGIVADGYSRLPPVLANTVASAARVSETAILQQFDPGMQNRAGLDQQERRKHAMLYGVEDKTSAVKHGPLSQYAASSLDDVLWLSVFVHAHRTEALPAYADMPHGLGVNRGAVILRNLMQASPRKDDIQEISKEDQSQLENLVALAMRGVVNRIVTEPLSSKKLVEKSMNARRDAINGLQKSNFFALERDDLVHAVDLEAKRPEPKVQEENFMSWASEAFFDSK